jgi:di/tripeptidase
LILALLTDVKVEHGPLEAVFTVEEETTTIGAIKLNRD